MKIGIIGATGRVGSRVLLEAKRHHHDVTAIVRNPTKLSDLQTNILNKDIFMLTEDDIVPFDVIVNAFGAPIGQEHMHIKVAEHLISLLHGKRRPKLVVVGGAGSLSVDDKGSLLLNTPEFPPEVKPTAVAQMEVLNILRRVDDFEWTFISPAAVFAPGERTGIFRLGKDHLLVDKQGVSHISMEDYAVALINEIENPEHINARFTVGY